MPAADVSTSETVPPWTWPWWRATKGQEMVLFWIVLIHITAAIGLILYPVPAWSVFFSALALAWIGGLGTTVCYHRALAHRALTLHPVVREIFIFLALLNGSGAPRSWTANHRLHHAKAETPEDISSPQIGGFWWSHLRWLWQADQPSVERYCPDLKGASYTFWQKSQIGLLAASFLVGLPFGAAAFFWLGAIRLVFALHGQCFVNSVSHLQPNVAPGEDSSRNVAWLALWHCFEGENWHRNHHARPGSAQFGWTPTQIDLGWYIILGLERLGLATEVRRHRTVESD